MSRAEETSPQHPEETQAEAAAVSPAAAAGVSDVGGTSSTADGRFVLEVDLARLDGDPYTELGRILRYWGGNLQHYPLRPGSSETVWTATAEVGRWRVEPTPG